MAPVVDTIPVANALQAHFEARGERFELSGLKPLLLDDPQSVWLIASGKVELFTVAVQQGEPKGHRNHFTSIQPGELMFGMDLGRYGAGSGFLAVGKMGTLAWKLPIAELASLGLDANVAPLLARCVDLWVSTLARALVRSIVPIPRADINLGHGEQAELLPRQRLRAAQGVAWLVAEPGDLLFIGVERFDPGRQQLIFPVTTDVWVERPAARDEVPLYVQSYPVADATAEASFWAGLASFHRLLCYCEFVNKKLAKVDEFNRLNDKAEHTEAARSAAYEAIAAVMVRPQRRGLDLSLRPEDPHFISAARLVAGASGIEVVVPPSFDAAASSQDRLLLVSRASRFRSRTVALRDRWWTQDHGPVLGQMVDGEEPVALLPEGPGRYRYVIPSSGESGRVDDDFIDRLSPFGAVFYRPLPDGKLGALDLVRFGLRGLGPDLAMLVIAGLLIGALGALTPLFTGQIYDAVIPEAERVVLLQLGFGLLNAALVAAALGIVQQTAALRIQGQMDYAIQAAVWDRLLNLPSRFFHSYSAGDLAQRAGGISAIRALLAGAGITAVLGTITSVFFVALMFIYNTQLALLGLALTALFVAFTFVANWLQIRWQRVQLAVQGSIAGLVLQLLGGVGKLRTSGAEAHAFKVWAEKFAENRRLAFRIGVIQNWVAVFNTAFPVLSSLAVFAMLVSMVSEAGSPMSTGQFIAFNAAYGAFLGAVVGLSNASLDLLRAIPLFERLKPIIETEAEVDATKQHPGEITGAIELSHVHFRYNPDQPWVVNDLSLRIEPGEFIAFVGGSGCGKSTLMRLIVGFEKPEKGSVYYDGKDLDSLDLREVRQQMGVVLQDSQLLPVDIFRNIVGTSSRTIEEAWEAARKVGLDQDIKNMPMGMHTYVMEGGGTFSGGQKQRLLLARAVVNNPRIIILDEATSALDNRTQSQVTASMDRMQATRIVIAHRLSTIINADRICYLEAGQIVEMGNYEQLMALNGKFAALARRQIA